MPKKGSSMASGWFDHMSSPHRDSAALPQSGSLAPLTFTVAELAMAAQEAQAALEAVPANPGSVVGPSTSQGSHERDMKHARPQELDKATPVSQDAQTALGASPADPGNDINAGLSTWRGSPDCDMDDAGLHVFSQLGLLAPPPSAQAKLAMAAQDTATPATKDAQAALKASPSDPGGETTVGGLSTLKGSRDHKMEDAGPQGSDKISQSLSRLHNLAMAARIRADQANQKVRATLRACLGYLRSVSRHGCAVEDRAMPAAPPKSEMRMVVRLAGELADGADHEGPLPAYCSVVGHPDLVRLINPCWLAHTRQTRARAEEKRRLHEWLSYMRSLMVPGAPQDSQEHVPGSRGKDMEEGCGTLPLLTLRCRSSQVMAALYTEAHESHAPLQTLPAFPAGDLHMGGTKGSGGNSNDNMDNTGLQGGGTSVNHTPLGDLLRIIPLDVIERNIWRVLPQYALAESGQLTMRRACKDLRDLANLLITCATHDLTSNDPAQLNMLSSAERRAARQRHLLLLVLDDPLPLGNAARPQSSSSSADGTLIGASALRCRYEQLSQHSNSGPCCDGTGDDSSWQMLANKQSASLAHLPALKLLQYQNFKQAGLSSVLLHQDPAIGRRVTTLLLVCGDCLTPDGTRDICAAFPSLTELSVHWMEEPLQGDLFLPFLDTSMTTLTWVDIITKQMAADTMLSLAGLTGLQHLHIEAELSVRALQLDSLLVNLAPLTNAPDDVCGDLPDYQVLFALTQLTYLGLPDIETPAGAHPDPDPADAAHLEEAMSRLAAMTRLKSLDLSRWCADAVIFDGIKNLPLLTRLAISSISLPGGRNVPAQGFLPQLRVLHLWDELEPEQLLKTLLPISPLKSLKELSRRHGGASHLRFYVSVGAADADDADGADDADNAEQAAADLLQVALLICAATSLVLQGVHLQCDVRPAGRTALPLKDIIPALQLLAAKVDHLSFGYWPEVEQDWGVLGQGMPSLLHIKLQFCHLSDAIMAQLKQIPALHGITVHGCTGIASAEALGLTVKAGKALGTITLRELNRPVEDGKLLLEKLMEELRLVDRRKLRDRSGQETAALLERMKLLMAASGSSSAGRA